MASNGVPSGEAWNTGGVPPFYFPLRNGASEEGSNLAESSVAKFNGLIKKWEDQKATTSLASFDPTEILKEIADILEKVRFYRQNAHLTYIHD